MLSKPAPAESSPKNLLNMRTFITELGAVARAILPDSVGEGCVCRLAIGGPRLQSEYTLRNHSCRKVQKRTHSFAATIASDISPVINTRVDGARQVCCLNGSVDSAAVSRTAPGIRTTVSTQDGRPSRISNTTALPPSRCDEFLWPLALTTTRLSTADEYEAVESASHVLAVPSSKGSGESCKELIAYSLRLSAPLLLQIPFQLLSPWSSLGGVAMSSMPLAGMGPPPSLQHAQKMAMHIQQLKQEEEEHFMALVFPGFDSSSFIWQITCWQAVEFVLSMLMGHKGANPLPCVLYKLGASWGPALARGQVWRLVSPVMLHANLTHLLFNVFFQLRMGFGMERQFGRPKMMMLYFACGVVGNLISVGIDPFKLAVGASTAGFGLIGVWMAEILLSWELLGPARERTMIWIGFMLVSVTTMSTMTPNMDLWGHLGGALGGFLLAIIISDMPENDRPPWYGQARAAAAICLAILLGGGATKAIAFTPHDPIPDCSLLPGFAASLPGPIAPLTATQ